MTWTSLILTWHATRPYLYMSLNRIMKCKLTKYPTLKTLHQKEEDMRIYSGPISIHVKPGKSFKQK